MFTRLWRAFLARWGRLWPFPSLVPETAPVGVPQPVGTSRSVPEPPGLGPAIRLPETPVGASLAVPEPRPVGASLAVPEPPRLGPASRAGKASGRAPEPQRDPFPPPPPPEDGCYLTDDMGPEEQRRRLREQYEKERRKHDKFVEPKGPHPVKRQRVPVVMDEEELDAHEPTHHVPEKERARPIPALDGPLVPEGFLIDQHHEGGKVLFEEAESWGQFNFRDTILGQLERYFVYLRRMRRTDKSAYDLYRAVGATIEPYLSNVWHGEADAGDAELLYKFSEETIEYMKRDELSPAFIRDRPAFGCVTYGTDPLSESRELTQSTKTKRVLWIPKFMYFTKFEKPPIKWQPMSRVKGDVYGLTVWWDRPHDPREYRRKYGVPQDFGVWVSKDGKTIRILKQHLKWNRWAYPHDFKDWAKNRGVDVQVFLRHLFIMAVRHAEDIELSMVRVNVHKRDLTAVFGVNVERLAYFFQDRDFALTATGSRKRIFHLVKPYQRKDGSWTKMYFAGEREFEWAGYHVQLTVPGLHHQSLNTFHYGSIDSGRVKDPDNPKKYVSTEYMAKIFAEYIRTGKIRKGD
jgi:hypothetical protein